MKKNIPTALISTLLILLWIYAAVSKLLDYSNFHVQLLDSPYTTRWANMLVWLLPISEIAIAVLLLRRTTRLLGMYSSFFLMLAFTVYIYILLHFGTYQACSCGGIIAQLSIKNHFWFNTAFMLLAGVGVYLLPVYKKQN